MPALGDSVRSIDGARMVRPPSLRPRSPTRGPASCPAKSTSVRLHAGFGVAAVTRPALSHDDGLPTAHSLRFEVIAGRALTA